MKKLSAILLILAAVPLANATVTLSVSSNTVSHDGAFTVYIASDNTDPYVKYLDFSPQTACLPDMAIRYGEIPPIIIDPEIPNPYDQMLSSDFPAAPGIQFTVNVIATGSIGDKIYIDLFDGQDPYPIEAEQIVTIVPEPATIALLCLGGLMLRRKK
jgi:hypothetical protein